METSTEMRELTSETVSGIAIEDSDFRLLIQNYKWPLVWSALVFANFYGSSCGFLTRLRVLIRFPESDPAKILRAPPLVNYDIILSKDLWKYQIMPYLCFRDQIQLSRTCQFFFRLLSDLHALRNEFPAYFKEHLLQLRSLSVPDQLAALRAVAYPEPDQHLRRLFDGVVTYNSPSEFLVMAAPELLKQWVMQERKHEPILKIENFSPLHLSVILDNLPLLLFFLNCLERTTPLDIDIILKYSCQYAATSIIEFFLWAFPTNDKLKFDSYLHIACEYHQISVVQLLAPRVHATTLTMCLVSLEKDSKAAPIIACITAHGGSVPEEVTNFLRLENACNSNLMKEIIRADLGTTLSIFIKRWPSSFKPESLSTIFYYIFQRRYSEEVLLLDVIAFILSHSKRIQTTTTASKSFPKFLRALSKSIQLNTFLTVSIPKWNVKFLPASRLKLITAVCRSGHVENFQVLLANGVVINDFYDSKKHVLTSPLSRVAFSYSSSRPLFNFLIEQGAVFTPHAVCHAVTGGQLAGVEALMRLPDAFIPNDSLEYHPLFVAAQFGRLDCFDFLMSQGVTFASLTIEQKWEFLIQGPMAGLLQLRNANAYASWPGPLYKMRQRLLQKMLRTEIGNKYGFPEANPFEFALFLREKSDAYLNIISVILPLVAEKILDNSIILSIAVSTGNVKLLLLVLPYLPVIDAVDEKDRNCLLQAVILGNVKMVIVLLEHGANIQMKGPPDCPLNAAAKNPEMLAVLINSRQYALLNFPNLPNKKLCESCLPFLTEKSGNPIIPPLAVILYERYRLHLDMVPLQKILKKIIAVTVGNGWDERGFGRIIIAKTSYAVPGIIAAIYNKIIDLYRLPYDEATNLIPTVHQSIHDLATIKGFRLRFHSSTIIEVCHLIVTYLPEQSDHFPIMNEPS